MRVIVSSPDLRPSLYSLLDGLLESGLLRDFVTQRVFDPRRPLDRWIQRLVPPARSAARTVPARLAPFTRSIGAGDLLRAAAGRVNGQLGHRLWLRQELAFDRRVAREFAGRAPLLVGMEHAALTTFQAQKAAGLRTLLRQVTAHGDVAYAQYQRERERHPTLYAGTRRYLLADLERSRERKRAEYALADRVLCNSDYVAATMVAHGLPPERVVAIPTGCPPLTAAPANAGRGSAPLKLLYVGTLGVRKGASELLEAWRALSDGATTLTLAGHIDIPEWAAQFRSAGARVLGHVDRETLAREFADADVFVLPSHLEGLAHSLLEALSAGLPIIATQESGAGRFLEPGRNGWLVNAGDVGSLNDALTAALDQRAQLPAMGARSQQLAAGWTRAQSNAAALAALIDLAAN
jgi:glycosyltransferase involved in cell wall biosynthesis